MLRILAFVGFLLICSFSFGQNSSAIYVKLNGSVKSEKDSTAIAATLSYEKLPYFDDMGLTKTSTQGTYEFYLENGITYNFTIKATGFQSQVKEIKVEDPDEDREMVLDIYMVPDGEIQLITLENLIFSRGSDQISSSSYQELDQLVVWLNDRPSIIIQLEGHTDFEGNEQANLRLSQARVESVKEYLKSKGIKKTRVLTKAFGGSQPLTRDRTDEAKARNRRVEVRVLRN